RTDDPRAVADAAYMRAQGGEALSPAMYYSHNLLFIAACASMDGDYAEAHKASTMLAAHVGPHVKAMPPLEGFMTVPMAVEIRFQKRDEILAMPKPIPPFKPQLSSGTSPPAWPWPLKARSAQPHPTPKSSMPPRL